MHDPSSESRIAAVLAAASMRRRALVDQDIDAIGKILAEDLTYTHTGGNTEDYNLHISLLKTKMRYIEIDDRDLNVRVYGPAAILTGVSTVTGQMADADPVTFSCRILQVWVESDGGWRLAAHQGTKLT